MKHHSLLIGTLLAFSVGSILAQPAGFNYDEAKVPQYTLPDPLRMSSGQEVSTAQQWNSTRRNEILELFREHVYGRSPGAPPQLTFVIDRAKEDRNALGGIATRRHVRINVGPKDHAFPIDLLLYIPNGVTQAPAFLGLNFGGNHAVHRDTAIPLPTSWMRSNNDGSVTNNRATEKGRGKAASRWPIEMIVQRGYAVGTIYYGDIEPDHADGFRDGIRGWYAENVRDGQPHTWGALAAWGWGLSRALDYLQTDPQIDSRKVAVLGHSRLGKTALWAGAEDPRFSIVISNNSGEGGAAITRRKFGETIERINTSFPHWFTSKYKTYNGKEDDLPLDFHMLIALMAPRPVYIASAEEDSWADPKGEFLAGKHADPVYKLLGKEGLGASEMPALNQPVGRTIGYHIRTGKHDVTEYDWQQYLNFADRHFGRGKQ